MKIVILGKVELLDEDKKQLEAIGEVITHDEHSLSDDELINKIDDAEIVISFLIPFSETVLKTCSQKNLKLIVLATTGFDDVDTDVATQNNITVCYIPGYATNSVAEHTVGLMLAAARHTLNAALDLRDGKYDPTLYTGKLLMRKTVGIVGVGRIGGRVKSICEALGMNVISYDKDLPESELESLLNKSDVISMHLPLNSETRNFISDEQFEMMKEGVIIVNTARGGVIDEAALVKNLENGKVFAAGLDVCCNMPPKDLVNMKNVIVTPHMAYNTEEALQERSKTVIENVKKFIDGDPQNSIC